MSHLNMKLILIDTYLMLYIMKFEFFFQCTCKSFEARLAEVHSIAVKTFMKNISSFFLMVRQCRVFFQHTQKVLLVMVINRYRKVSRSSKVVIQWNFDSRCMKNLEHPVIFYPLLMVRILTSFP